MLHFGRTYNIVSLAAWTRPCLNGDMMRQVGKPRDQLVGSIPTEVTLLGAPYKVWVHFGKVRGRTVCVGLDIRGFTSDDTMRNIKPLPGWDELNSPRLRALAIATLVEDMRKLFLDMSQAAQDRPDLWGLKDESSQTAFKRASKALRVASAVRSGRPPMLTDDELRNVVAPAYLAGGRKPVQAVREALERHQMPGAGHQGEVTIDQARKNVQRARQLGFIPKAVKKGKP